MRAVQMSGAGDPSVLVPGERAVPTPGAREVLVRVAAAGVNGPDIFQRKGLYPAPPGASELLGLEIAGQVVAVGESVRDWQVGDRICALTNGGGYAQYCAVDQRHCLPVPAGLSMVEAGSLPETFFTVWSNIFKEAGLRGGQNFVVHGGAGGIGSTSIQLAKAFGATVFATCVGDAQAKYCASIGADRAIDNEHEDFVDIVREQGGADVILDILAGPFFERNIKACRHDATIVQLAFNLGSKVQANLMPIMLKRLKYTGSTLRTRSDEYKAEVARELREQVWPHIEAGRIKAVVDTTMPLEQARAAHELMESAAHSGKIMLIVDESV
ncbi:MAG: NAD(P)H-quinone oxidoreductase [Gammaproteobacteria bacterium]|nr:NAD(P)H-quinone oxidoreductase [Gammaproteobacteria bacterium]